MFFLLFLVYILSSQLGFWPLEDKRHDLGLSNYHRAEHCDGWAHSWYSINTQGWRGDQIIPCFFTHSWLTSENPQKLIQNLKTGNFDWGFELIRTNGGGGQERTADRLFITPTYNPLENMEKIHFRFPRWLIAVFQWGFHFYSITFWQ